MSKANIIRAWKDESYRMSLSEAERAQLPENPAGPVELADSQLGGAGGSAMMATASFCSCATKSWQCSLCDGC